GSLLHFKRDAACRQATGQEQNPPPGPTAHASLRNGRHNHHGFFSFFFGWVSVPCARTRSPGFGGTIIPVCCSDVCVPSGGGAVGGGGVLSPPAGGGSTRGCGSSSVGGTPGN